MTKRLTAISLTVLLAAAGGCGKSKEQQEAEAAQQKLQDAVAQLQKQATASGRSPSGDLEAAVKHMQAAVTAAKTADPVDFRELKALMPETFAGLKRKSLTGEKTGAMGMAFSQAEAKYESDDAEARVSVHVVDNAGVAGVAAAAQAGWAAVEVDKETDTGYEKSITVDGHKGMERYDRGSRSGSVHILVKGRFMIVVEASGVEAATLQKAAKELPLGKFRDLAK